MKDYSPWVVEMDNELIITTKNPLPLGHFIEKIQTLDGEVIYSGKYRVVSCDRAPWIGQTGTVRDFTLAYSGEEETSWPGIEFDEEIANGHSLDDHETGEVIAWGCGWFCPPETLVPLEESINIEEII